MLIGVVVAVWGTGVIAAAAPAELPRMGVFALDADPALEKQLRAAAHRRGGYAIEDPKVMADAVAGVTRVGGMCDVTDGACLAKLAIAADVDALLVGRADWGAARVQLTFVDTIAQTSTSADGTPQEAERVALMLLGIEELVPPPAVAVPAPAAAPAAAAPASAPASASASAAAPASARAPGDDTGGPGPVPWIVAGAGGALALGCGIAAVALDLSLTATLLDAADANGRVDDGYYARELAFGVTTGAAAVGLVTLGAGLVWAAVASGDDP